jgi:hypothetical protein
LKFSTLNESNLVFHGVLTYTEDRWVFPSLKYQTNTLVSGFAESHTCMVSIPGRKEKRLPKFSTCRERDLR